jgi:hypothetical protein
MGVSPVVFVTENSHGRDAHDTFFNALKCRILKKITLAYGRASWWRVMRHYGLNPGTVICSPRGPKMESVCPS